MLEGTGAKFTIVQFIKQDGSLRTMLIQHAAAKFRVKGEAAPEHKRRAAETRAYNHPELFNTYDVDRNAIRSVNLDTVITIRSFGRDLYSAPQLYIESMLEVAS
ncbi:MAG: hypothetical protein A3E01_07750 [Gammaproteobacteria bacterium RIFCSPHIGHO2_12_FULL_63_22]|nr:MAG: hypothetical protein A3E01_07750 [Gammaproteobacteria bacterium RIFCSPHIGHO2_12_FULL_63_22]